MLFKREKYLKNIRPFYDAEDIAYLYARSFDYAIQKRNGIQHINLIEHMASGLTF